MYISFGMPRKGRGQGFARRPAAAASKPKINGSYKTFVLTVKLTTFLLLAGLLQVSARTTAQQRISLSLKGVTLEKAFAEIEKRSGYSVFYNVEVLKSATSLISLDVHDATIDDVLHQCLKGLPLQFTIQDKTIFVKKDVVRAEVMPQNGSVGPAPQTLGGTVKSELGAPLMGATVYVVKLKKSAVTDKQGQYTIKDVPDGEYEVEISYIGYEPRKMKVSVVNHEAWLAAELKLSMSNLDETVVKGYYSTTNRLNTGDVTTVKGTTINEQPVSDPILALEGRVPGLYIQQTSGAPGAYSTISIMGQNSISNGNDPLYIIDGVPFSSLSLSSTSMSGGAIPQPSSNTFNGNGGGLSPFNGLNPADIESIEVLKDADATAIYGSRGANGVILITTKKGKAGATHLDMNVYTGAAQVTRTLHLLNTSQYLAMRREAFHNDGLALPSINVNTTDNNYDIDGFWDTTRYTSWQKVFIGNAANFTNAQASITGGSPNTQFLVGAGYSKQGTVFIGNFSDQKASARFNLTHASTDQRFHLQMGAEYVYDNNYLPTADFTSSINFAPDAPALYKSDGSVNWAVYNGTSTFSNLAGSLLQSSKAFSNNLISNLTLGYQVLPGLQLRATLGYTKEEMYQSLLSPAASYPPPYNIDPDFAATNFANTTFSTWLIEPQVDYQNKIGPGRLDALVGGTFQQNIHNSLTQYASGFSSDALINDPLAASTTALAGINYTLYRYEAIYGRLGYNIGDKYIMNLTARRDGSSRFGPGRQFGNFGAVGIGWIFSKERFFDNHLQSLSFGKLRASYGATGNDQIPDYQFLSTYAASSTTYESITGLTPTGLTNPLFAWEQVKKLEGGLDLGFLKDRILISGTYYRNRTGNQLVGAPLPQVTGFTSVYFNLPAVVQNSGGEFTINTVNVRSHSFKWTTSINLTLPSNKLVAFPNLAGFPGYSNSYIVGKSLFIRKVYHWTGVNPQSGLYSFATKNSNGTPSAPQDQIVTKPVTQRYYGGMQNSFSYRGLQLDVFIQYVDQIGYNIEEYFTTAPGITNANQPNVVLKRWTTAGNLSSVQRFGTGTTVRNPYSTLRSSDAVISDASFIRLKNIAFSYTLPNVWTSRAHLQLVKLYLQCQNLFTLTRYFGLDPETMGIGLPPLRMITGGIQVNL